MRRLTVPAAVLALLAGCGDPVEQAITAEDVTAVRVGASGADHAAAWHAVVLGQEA